VAAPILTREFALSATQYGWIVSTFLLSYALMQVAAGALVDLVGTRRGLAVALGGWSAATMAHAAAAGPWSLAGARLCLGAFEAANFPAAVKAISEWCSRAERSAAIGLISVGPGLGAVLAQPLVAGLIVAGGWRVAFAVVGAIGVAWLLLWLWLYDVPARHRWLTEAQRAAVVLEVGRAGDCPSGGRHARLLRDRALWGLLTSRFIADGSFYFFVFWLPTYLADVRGFGIADIGLFAWIPYLASDAGALAGGALGAALTRRGWSLAAARTTVLWVGALVVPLSLPVLFVDSAWWALACLALAMFGIQVRVVAHFTLPADLYAAGRVARIWGLTGAAGSLGAMAFTPAVGWAIDTWSYGPVFWMVVVTNLAAPLILQCTVVDRLRQVESAGVR
jgi:ACS family hexuronate transporter-like MFS transporter